MLIVDSTTDDAPYRHLPDVDAGQRGDEAPTVDHDEFVDLLALLREDVRLGAGKLSDDLRRVAGEATVLESAVRSLDELGHRLAAHAAAQTAGLPLLGTLRRLLQRHLHAVDAVLAVGGSDASAVAAVDEARQLSDLLSSTLTEVETALAPQRSHIEALAEVIELGTLRRRVDRSLGEQLDAARHRLERFEARLVLALRPPEAGERRREARLSVHIAARLHCGDRCWTGATVDLARGGALVAVETPFDRPPIGGCAKLELAELGAFPARIVALSAKGVHLAFDQLASARRVVLEGRLAALVALDAPFLDLARWAAREVEALFARGIAAGEITDAALFSSPAALLVGSVEAAGAGEGVALAATARDFLGQRLAPLQTQIAACRDETAYATCTDRHGYLPVVTAGPAAARRGNGQSAGSPPLLQNSGKLDESCNGIMAARSRRQHVAYMPDPQTREIAVPITVEGRHWGAFRLGFRPSGGNSRQVRSGEPRSSSTK